RRAEVVDQIRDRLPFLDWAPVCFTSAVRREGLPELFDTIDQAAVEFRRRIAPGEVTQTLRAAIERRPISVGGAPLTLYSAAQVSTEPPTFALRVNRPDGIHFSHARYLAKLLGLAPRLPAAGVPAGWGLKEFTGRAAIEVVREDAGVALRLRSVQSSFVLYRDAIVDLREFPILSWSWKVVKLPRAGDVRAAATDDQAA